MFPTCELPWGLFEVIMPKSWEESNKASIIGRIF